MVTNYTKGPSEIYLWWKIPGPFVHGEHFSEIALIQLNPVTLNDRSQNITKLPYFILLNTALRKKNDAKEWLKKISLNDNNKGFRPRLKAQNYGIPL